MSIKKNALVSEKKPIIGITIGDYNGIGCEILLKAFSDSRMFDYCIPVVYGSTKIIAYHKKMLQLETANHQHLKPGAPPQPRLLNVVNCIDENVIINVGQPSRQSGEAAISALNAALKDLKEGIIDALVTGPLDKSVIKLPTGVFTGHTDYIAHYFGIADTVMLLVCDKLKVALVTHHIPLKEVPHHITTKKILTKLEILHQALYQDFGIMQAKIAVLGLNPHAGDKGLLGQEEKDIIAPAIRKAQESGIRAYGPYPADGLLGSGAFSQFDVLLAMYHDQGLVAFKSLCFGNGVNVTAGLPVVRTSPDHGTAFDIAGKNRADAGSFRQAVFTACDMLRNRDIYQESTAHPLKKQQLEAE